MDSIENEEPLNPSILDILQPRTPEEIAGMQAEDLIFNVRRAAL